MTERERLPGVVSDKIPPTQPRPQIESTPRPAAPAKCAGCGRCPDCGK